MVGNLLVVAVLSLGTGFTQNYSQFLAVRSLVSSVPTVIPFVEMLIDGFVASSELEWEGSGGYLQLPL